MKKYSISFKYLDFNSWGRKYIIANSEEEAIENFKLEYKEYNIEITGVKVIKEVVKEEDVN